MRYINNDDEAQIRHDYSVDVGHITCKQPRYNYVVPTLILILSHKHTINRPIDVCNHTLII